MTDAPHTDPSLHHWWSTPLQRSRRWWALELGLSAALAAFALVEPRNLGRAQRNWYRVGLAGVVAAGTALGVARERGWWESGDLGWFTGTLATTLALADPMERLDARIAEALEARGIHDHRRWEAAAMLASSVVSAIRSFPRRQRGEDTMPEPRPLGPEVRSLLERILGAIDDYGARELRAQLDGAQEIRCEHGCSADLVVSPDAPRTRLSSYDFPVALGGDDEGAPVCVVLRVEKGCLEELEVLREGLPWEGGLDLAQDLDLEPMDWF